MRSSRNRNLQHPELLERRELLAVTLTNIAAANRSVFNGGAARLGGDVVAMDMGDFRVEFYDDYGGAPLAFVNQKNAGNVLVSDPFPGSGVQTVYSQGSSPTQATPNGPSLVPIQKFGTNTPNGFYVRETGWSTSANSATYQTTGFAPVFWDQRELSNGLPSIDAVPPTSVNEWLTAYSPGGVSDSVFTSCQEGNPFRGCVGVVYNGGSDGGIFMLGSEQGAVTQAQPWTSRLFEVIDGRVAMKARIRLADAPNPDTVATLMFQKDVPNNATEAQTYAAPGYFLSMNKFGEIYLYKHNDPNPKWTNLGADPILTGSRALAAQLADGASGALLELRTIRNGTRDTFQIWLENLYIGEWTDNSPVRGPHVGLFASASAGMIQFFDRHVYDLNTEIVSTYTGYDDGHLEADILVRTVSGAAVPTNMYHNSMPGAFLEWCPPNLTFPPCQFPNASAVGEVIDAGGDTIKTVLNGNPSHVDFAGPLKEDAFAYWLGKSDGSLGLFAIPRHSEVNGVPTPTRGQLDNNAGNFPNGNYPVRALQLGTFSNFALAPRQVTSTRLVSDWWPEKPNIAQLLPPQISIANAQVHEGDGGAKNMVFTVSLSKASSQVVTVDYETEPGTATAGVDFTSRSGQVVFNPNVTSRTITVPILGDLLDEVNETVFVNLSSPNKAVIADGQGLGAIVDQDPAPSLSINDITFSPEGDAGVRNAVFTASLTRPSGRTITANYNTSSGTATQGTDFNPASGQLTFAPGVTSRQIQVGVRGDTQVENNENFRVTLSNTLNVVLADSVGIATIVDDDDPRLSVSSPPSNTEDNEPLSFNLSLDRPSVLPVVADYETTAITATAVLDYQPVSGSVTFAPGQTTKTILVNMVEDNFIEANETFALDVTDVTNASIQSGRGIGTIRNDDAPRISFSSISIDEGDAGTSNAIVRAQVTDIPTQTPLSATLKTENGSAVSPTDFVAKTETFTIQPVAQTANPTLPVIEFSVQIVGDVLVESDESFFVEVAEQSGVPAVSGPSARAEVTVVNDDFATGDPDQIGVVRGNRFILDLNENFAWDPTVDLNEGFGQASDTPIKGDWNGDGHDEVGVRRGNRFILDLNGNFLWDGPTVDLNVGFGQASDTPISGDWNGDGVDEVGVHRGNRFILDVNGNYAWDGPNVDLNKGFGRASDTPITGDWNGDGVDEVGVHRGNRFILDVNGNYAWDGPNVDLNRGFGRAGDSPLTGDWNGDGVDEVRVHRGNRFILDANGSFSWSGPSIDVNRAFGRAGDTPLVGNWKNALTTSSALRLPEFMAAAPENAMMATRASRGFDLSRQVSDPDDRLRRPDRSTASMHQAVERVFAQYASRHRENSLNGAGWDVNPHAKLPLLGTAFIDTTMESELFPLLPNSTVSAFHEFQQ